MTAGDRHSSIWVIGSGGHAKVLIATLRHAGYRVAGVLDDDASTWGRTVLGVPISRSATRGAIEALGVRHAVLAIGANRARAMLADRLDGAVIWDTIVHPTAHIAEGIRIGAGTVIFAGAVVQVDTVIGDHVILNTGCTVDHDGIVDDFAHIAPGANLAGGVHIGAGALMGIGSSAVPGSAVGAWATVGAGSVVVQNIPPDVTAVGAPARNVQGTPFATMAHLLGMQRSRSDQGETPGGT